MARLGRGANTEAFGRRLREAELVPVDHLPRHCEAAVGSWVATDLEYGKASSKAAWTKLSIGIFEPDHAPKKAKTRRAATRSAFLGGLFAMRDPGSIGKERSGGRSSNAGYREQDHHFPCQALQSAVESNRSKVTAGHPSGGWIGSRPSCQYRPTEDFCTDLRCRCADKVEIARLALFDELSRQRRNT